MGKRLGTEPLEVGAMHVCVQSSYDGERNGDPNI